MADKKPEDDNDIWGFIFIIVFAFVAFWVLYELSFIPFPEGTLGP